MLITLGLLLSCQLVGEVAVRASGTPIPGPVAGLALLVAILLIWPDLATRIRPTVSVVLANLSLMFVPAGVGVISNLDALAEDWLALLVVVVGSTFLAMLAAVGTFIGAARLLEGRRVP
ncbi:CidA/LrgA family protein [Roseovarius sp. D0-M9]|uniref:CidA/LrgA family protein n=1 Tax=Roseovarius sp. D0-M9 TaxID=3127117 RepID=UPI00300FE843